MEEQEVHEEHNTGTLLETVADVVDPHPKTLTETGEEIPTFPISVTPVVLTADEYEMGESA